MTKHFIDLDDHSFQDLQGIIDNAIALKKISSIRRDTRISKK